MTKEEYLRILIQIDILENKYYQINDPTSDYCIEDLWEEAEALRLEDIELETIPKEEGVETKPYIINYPDRDYPSVFEIPINDFPRVSIILYKIYTNYYSNLYFYNAIGIDVSDLVKLIVNYHQLPIISAYYDVSTNDKLYWEKYPYERNLLSLAREELEDDSVLTHKITYNY